MPIIEPSAVRDRLAHRPTVAFAEGELLLRQGAITERLLFLTEGAVDIVRDQVTLARVGEPGAVLGDMAVISRPPAFRRRARGDAHALCRDRGRRAAAAHRAGSRASMLMTVLASRLDAVNGLLVEAREQLGDAGPQRGFFADMLDNLGLAMRAGVPL